MKHAFAVALGLVMLPLYTVSYALAKALNLDKENEMPTLKEWLSL